MKEILLVEDDEGLNNGIVLAFAGEDYRFCQCGTSAQARKALGEKQFDLLILDIQLPDGSGLDLCREVRKQSQVPIIFLTARDLELDIVAGLESGSDDYITKPFSLMVLRARVRALFRRQEAERREDREKRGEEYQRGPFFFQFDAMKFEKNGRTVELSKTEQRLLRLLVENEGQTLGRERLLEWIWPEGTEYVEDNALSVTIRRLRRKLEDVPDRPEYIRTVYGLGYVWECGEQ